MKRSNLLLMAAITILGLQLTRAADIDADARAAAERVAVRTCANCHGPAGHSSQPKFPILAGQQATYIVSQLQAFKMQTRADPDALGYMWGMAAQLDDGLMTGLADYYSRQSAVAGQRDDPALLARGKELYENGDAAHSVPACATCHGAGGSGTEMFPRLAGQHSQYTIKQMRSFQNNMRSAAVMREIVRGLQHRDMVAVAAYLQSLGPV